MKDTTLILVVIVLACIIIFPSLFAVGTGFLNDIVDWIKHGFADMEENTGKLAVEITYADGTTRTIEPETAWGPLTVYDDTGKEIKRIQGQLWVKTGYTGTVTTYAVNGSFNVNFDNENKVTRNIDKELTSIPPSDEDTKIWTEDVWSSTIETWDNQAYTQHTITFEATVTVQLVFTDGTVASKSGSGQASTVVSVEQDTGITSLTVTVASFPLHDYYPPK